MDKPLNEKEMRSLISLIDDDEVYETVFAKIVDLGDEVASLLDQEIEVTLNPIKNNRLQTQFIRQCKETILKLNTYIKQTTKFIMKL